MAEKTLNVKIISRHDTEAAWIEADPVLLEGEVAYSTDKNNRYKVGDGTSKWSALAYSKADPMTHTHTKSQISDFPTSLKNPSALTIQFNGTTNKTYDGSSAQTVNITPGGIGAATSGHTHSTASTSAAGFLRQLNGSTANFLRGDGTWATPPNTTYSTMKGATSSAAGATGLVPAPAAGKQTSFLRGDGTWVVPTNTNTTYSLSKSGSTITLTGSDGSKTSVTDSNTTYSLSSFGITATAAELNYIDGVTSNVQAQLNNKAASSHTHNYAGSSSAGGSANSAVKLNTSTAGSATQPVYFSGGKPVACTYTLGKSVPSNAVFTDTNTWIAFKGATTSAAGTAGYVPAPAAGAANRYFRSDGVWAVPPNTNTTYTLTKSGSTITLTGSDGSKTSVADSNTTYSLSSFGITATAAELNKLDGVTATAKELNYVDGVTSNIQTQLNGKAASSHTHNYAGSSSAGGAANSLNYFQNTSNLNVGQDTSTSNAIAYINDYSGTALTSSVKDGAIYRQVYSSSWVHQIYGDYRSGSIAVRGKNNGTWKSWKRVLDEGNYKTFVTPSSIGAATSSHTHKYAGSSSAGGSATSAVKLDTATAGSATRPVYFSGGKPVACTYTLAKSVPSNAVFTDTNTTNTAGSTNTSSKIFLVGATSQASAPVTYSHDTVYVGTDGCIYSSGLRVATEVYQSSEPTAQVVNDIWMQAY